MAEALTQARIAEERARAAQAAAEDERRRARRERDELVKTARDDAERLVDELRTEVRGIRRKLERETVTQRSLDEDLERARGKLERLPETEPKPIRTGAAVPVAWRENAPDHFLDGHRTGQTGALGHFSYYSPDNEVVY